MYEELVAEYLAYEVPSFIERRGGIAELPAPRERNLIYSVIGVRRCGKTFYLFQLMRKLLERGMNRRQVLYFPFDDDRLGDIDGETGSRVLDAYFKLVPEALEGCYLFFDEIQDLPNWEAFVRRAAEQHRATVVVTGSSAKLLSTDIPTRLRGRSLPIEMWPLDFAEFCRFNGYEAAGAPGAYSRRMAGELSRAFSDYLDRGGFPAAQALDATTRVQLLQAYADEVVTKDVLERFGNASFRAGRRFALSALRSTALKFSVNRQVNTMRSAGISISSESAYALLDDLEDAHLAFKVADYSLSIKDNPKSSYKVYSVDPGLSLAVAPANHVDLGQRLETAVFLELKRRHGGNRENVIARYSGPKCPEVDFVVGDVMLDAEYELVQASVESGVARSGADGAASAKFRSEVGNLAAAMGETGLRDSILVTLDEREDIPVDSGTVHVVPAWDWFLRA